MGEVEAAYQTKDDQMGLMMSMVSVQSQSIEVGFELPPGVGEHTAECIGRSVGSDREQKDAANKSLPFKGRSRALALVTRDASSVSEVGKGEMASYAHLENELTMETTCNSTYVPAS